MKRRITQRSLCNSSTLTSWKSERVAISLLAQCALAVPVGGFKPGDKVKVTVESIPRPRKEGDVVLTVAGIVMLVGLIIYLTANPANGRLVEVGRIMSFPACCAYYSTSGKP